jgi:hypothetical protein
MNATPTLTLEQLDSLCHALEDYLHTTLHMHYGTVKATDPDFSETRNRLTKAFYPILARVDVIKQLQNIPIEIA